MKKLLLILFTLHLSLFSANAQRLTVTKTTIDVGRTGYQQPITATFELRNRGLRRLVIESVKPDCGCTAVDYPKEVGIGDKFTIKMTYDARQLGHFQKMAAIKSNGSKEPVYLTMKGIVLAELIDYSGTYPLAIGDLLLDKNELEYDDVNKGDHPVQEIHILNNSMQEMTPNVMHLPPYLTAIVQPEKLAPGKPGTISVTLNSEKLRDYGLNQTSVYLAHQLGDKVSQDNEIGVSAVLLPDLKDYDNISKALAPQLQMSTTEIDFTDFGKKSKKTTEIILQNTGRTILKITSMQMFTRGLKVTLGKTTLEPGQTTTMKVTGVAEELKKVRTRPRILMITNDPDHAKVVINISK
ncbi:MAG: DUF1573 domain-containing protein [Prevotella sp.]|nr:DUF1573 domain-containing protein [Prevotella sp.]